MYVMNSALGMDKKTVGSYFWDPGMNGLQSTDDLLMKLKYELVFGRSKNNSLYMSIRDDDKEKSVDIYLHEVDPLRNASGNPETVRT